ncbi:MAG: hypothetical protein QXP41_01850 [Candidatus Nitrosocaldus sp.]
MFAKNLTEGYYSPSDPYQINLWNGPGYPIVLVPFVLLKLPLLTVKLLNPFFLFLAIIYFNNTLRFYMKDGQALFFSYLLAIYPPFMRYIHRILTEQFAIFLICGLIFHFCKIFRNGKRSSFHIAIASFYLGFLALTKIIFGYVILSGLLLFLVLYLWERRITFRRTLLVYLFAIILCIPYLLYTYHLTGKIFYWGNSGGLALYLMSSPYDDELGDWHERSSEYHQEFFNKLYSDLPPIQRDDELRKEAIKNIVNYPFKFLKNWLANIGRLLFHYPYSYTPQKLSTYFYILPNMFLVVFFTLSIYPAYKAYKLIPFEIWALMLFALIAFTGSTFGNAENRYFWPLVPVFTLWTCFIFSCILKINIKSGEL